MMSVDTVIDFSAQTRCSAPTVSLVVVGAARPGVTYNLVLHSYCSFETNTKCDIFKIVSAA